MQTDLYEALRYAGIRSPDDSWLEKIQRIAMDIEAKIHPRWIWRCFPVRVSDDGIILENSGMILAGQSAYMMLQNCHHAALLAATLGPEMDAIIRTVSVRNMEEALLTDACGSALIEACCNKAEKEILKSFPSCYLSDRFSPGYGDLSLNCQGTLLRVLDATKRCGIYLTDSMLMNPSKSVTAVIGISDEKQRARIRGCAYCLLKDSCEFRKGGKTCAGTY